MSPMHEETVRVEGVSVAFITHPAPRGSWFLDLTHTWRWDAPDVPRVGPDRWRFRTRTALLAFLRTALHGPGGTLLARPLHVGDTVRWRETGRWRHSVIAQPDPWYEPDEPVPTQDGIQVPVAELQVMVTGPGGRQRWEPAIVAL